MSLLPAVAADSAAEELAGLLPVHYVGAKLVSVVYRVDARDADEAIGDSRVRAVRLPLDSALLTVTWFHYPESSIGAYEELAVSVIATRAGPPRRLPLLRALMGDAAVGGFVLHLPVTSELACRGGRELFGFPKTVQEIDIAWLPNTFVGSVHAGHARVLSMHVPLARGIPVHIGALSTFSVREGTLLAARVSLRGGRAQLLPATNVSLDLAAPALPIARTLRALVGRRRPLAVLQVSGFDAELGRATTVDAPQWHPEP